MDKEAQEKLIASVLLEEGVMRSEVAADMVALKIRQRLDMHRNLPDRPKLREKIAKKLREIYRYDLDWYPTWAKLTQINKDRWLKKADQILALHIPKDKPPLLSEEALKEVYMGTDYHYSFKITQEMKLDEAIERLEVFLRDVSEGAPELLDDALKLGIEALKGIKKCRQYPECPFTEPLPGETDD